MLTRLEGMRPPSSTTIVLDQLPQGGPTESEEIRAKVQYASEAVGALA